LTSEGNDNHTDDVTAAAEGAQELFIDAEEPDEVGVTDIDELEEVIPFTYSITSFGADFLAQLFRVGAEQADAR
jgi:hypothetical protein